MSKYTIINDGFIYPEVTKDDFVLGKARSAQFEVINPIGDWRHKVPVEEVQKRGNFDSNSCTDFGSLTLVQIVLDFLYGEKRNFSERYQAVVSEQTQQGNDPHKVMESMRKKGLIDDALLPFNDGIKWDWETYFSPNPMTDFYLNEGQKFLEEYEIEHEYIYEPGENISDEEKKKRLLDALKRSPVGVSVYAWTIDGDILDEDIFIKPKGVRDTHWCVLVGAEEGKYWYIFDSYAPFLKKLRWDFTFDITKGIYLKKKEVNDEVAKKTLFERLVERLFRFILKFF